MKYPKLYKAKVIKKYKMFFIDAILEETNEVVNAYTRNKGGFKKEMSKDSTVYLSYDGNPKRKTKYSVELIEYNGKLSGVDTQLSNKLIVEYLNKTQSEISILKNEVQLKDSRLDLSLSLNGIKGYGEVKSVLTYNEDTAVFPESITERGQKHLKLLISLAKKGIPAYLFYIVQVPHAKQMRIRNEVDPTYYKLMKKAIASGVEVIALKCSISLKEINIDQEINIEN